MSSQKVTVIVPSNIDVSPIEEELAGLEYDLQVSVCESDGEIIEAVKDADVIVSVGPGFPRSVIEQIDKAAAIVMIGHGFNQIDDVAATEKGIMVANTAGFVTEEVANHTIMFILACAKKMAVLHQDTRNGVWNSAIKAQMDTLPPIYGQVLGLIGFGNIARAIVNRAKPFGLEVIMHDPYTPPWIAKEYRVEQVSNIEEVASQSDYVSIHVPLNDETQHFIGRSFFKAMKSTAYLINVSRGPIVDEHALVKALENNEIAGAGLDVFEEEPIPENNPLLKMNNVLVTPHSAGASSESFTSGLASAGQETARIIQGMWPMSLVNPDVKLRIPDRNTAIKL